MANTTVSFNDTTGPNAHGGGIWAGDELTLVSSTISGNRTFGAGSRGGGIHVDGSSHRTALRYSTVTENYTTDAAPGAGLNVRTFGVLTVDHSIVSGNFANGSPSDAARSSGTNTLNSNYSLLGTLSGLTVSGTATYSNDPGLLPLDFNGGLTPTHLPIPGSPAEDAGDPTKLLELVTPISVTSSTAADDLWPAANLIDNSGLPSVPTLDDYQSLQHAFVNGSNAWVTDDPGGFPSNYFHFGPAPVLSFGLAQATELNSIVVWGYPFGPLNNNEGGAFLLEFSNDGGQTFENRIHLVHQQTGQGNETIPFGQTIVADAVRMTIVGNYLDNPAAAGGDRVGLGEIKFLAGPVEIPFDQRGAPNPRVLNGRIDIGAAEFEAIPLGLFAAGSNDQIVDSVTLTASDTAIYVSPANEENSTTAILPSFAVVADALPTELLLSRQTETELTHEEDLVRDAAFDGLSRSDLILQLLRLTSDLKGHR